MRTKNFTDIRNLISIYSALHYAWCIRLFGTTRTLASSKNSPSGSPASGALDETSFKNLKKQPNMERKRKKKSVQGRKKIVSVAHRRDRWNDKASPLTPEMHCESKSTWHWQCAQTARGMKCSTFYTRDFQPADTIDILLVLHQTIDISIFSLHIDTQTRPYLWVIHDKGFQWISAASLHSNENKKK